MAFEKKDNKGGRPMNRKSRKKVCTFCVEKSEFIDYKDKGQLYEISVFNTGEHIADNDLPEIWDSFYRADKAHARNENRFGLGLSIVKSIMTNHNCGYSAENVEGGVIFRFEVPKDSDYYDEKTTN